MKGWETGHGGVGISLKSVKPETPNLGTVGGEHALLAIDYADELTMMWNGKIDAAAGDLKQAGVPAFMLPTMVGGRVVPETVLSDFYLNAGYVADNAFTVEAPPDYEAVFNAGDCYGVALRLANQRGWDVVIGAVQRSYDEAKYSGPDVHVWNRAPDGTMYDGQAGGKQHQHAVLGVISNSEAIEMSKKDLAKQAWSLAFGLTDVLKGWAMTEFKKSTTIGEIRLLVREVLRGSDPNEAYDKDLMDDPAIDKHSQYVPSDVKGKIRKYFKSMGLSRKKKRS